jgi:hypothetical protein
MKNIKIVITLVVPITKIRVGDKEDPIAVCERVKQALEGNTSQGWQMRRWMIDMNVPVNITVEPNERVTEVAWPFP